MVETVKKGLAVGVKTTGALGKIIFPVTLIVSILQYTPILPWIIRVVSPLMKWIGLPGEAAIPLVLGNFLNLYAGIGAILTLHLTVKEVLILAVMLSFSHNLLVEVTVAGRVGVHVALAVGVRVMLAIVSALLIHLIWQGGDEVAQYGMISSSSAEFSGWGLVVWTGVKKALFGIMQLAMIVIPLMVGIQILKDLKWLDVFSRWMSPLTRMLGMKENTSMTLAAGLLFGLAYGAGVMIQAVQEDGVSKKDVTLAFLFLSACHAVVEDTLLFVPLGIPVWPLLLIRLTTAVLLTMMVGFVWNVYSKTGRREAA
ncbi:nucleoside recognition family protein [Anoxybacillus sp. B7M1]|uniref:nucleoside recognition domain-containing protein n=1 Tax=unclassified Anoxybacillus TaxID=2639704 RepID=UPI0005CDB01B|nr:MULTISPECIES: nucleoside recognition domain-containing protein [unclassified Anoxybacillus]ANB55619.1 nucleoside recognition family protein [Anoxybacillus sp. B2M1]ANB64844.1 nucleoside recognition family protein [Anoxybacillus sp. B7M1]